MVSHNFNINSSDLKSHVYALGHTALPRAHLLPPLAGCPASTSSLLNSVEGGKETALGLDNMAPL